MRLKTLAVATGALALLAAAIAPLAIRATATQAASGKAATVSAKDFSGFWVIDRKASDKPPQGRGGPGGHHGEWGGPPPGGPGGPGGPEGMGGPEGGRGGMRRMLPPTMRITSSETGISVSDSSGTIVQVITLGTVAREDGQKQPPEFGGVMKSGKLVVTHEGPRGAVTESFDLDEGGKRLVVETTMAGRNGEKRTMKRVYNRSGA